MGQKRYDVGIYGLWYGNNYGSISTYYALNCVLQSMGYSTVMIWNPLEQASLHIEDLPPSSPLRFAAQHYDISPRYDLEQMKNLNDICDTFLIGSDQLWNYDLSRDYKQSYCLDFADEGKNLVSYATSFGVYPYNGPEEEKQKIRQNLGRFHALSVRDSFSLKILEEDIGLEGRQMIDPVFLCDRREYERLIEDDEAENSSSGFIFAYILDPEPEVGQSLLAVMNETGKKMKLIFDLAEDGAWLKERLSLSDSRLEILEGATVSAWLQCFRDADFVITDSFHGACFSIIFEKFFVVRRNNLRGGKRFLDLLSPLGLAGQMVTHTNDFPDRIKAAKGNLAIDYEKVRERLREKRSKGLAWLEEMLDRRYLSFSKVITQNLDMDMCVGCGACVSACPKDAMQLEPDLLGYYRPVLSYKKCVDCGLCTQVCPSHQVPERSNEAKPHCYEFMAADEKTLLASSSGGAFTVIAEEAFCRGGDVAEVAWKDTYSVEHILIERKEDLPNLQKSKYLQSYMGNIFREVRASLEAKRFVLFSGCPCQAAGLKKFLGREYENLLLVDILCANAPSSLFFRKYVTQAFPDGITEYRFRTKRYGHDCTAVEILDSRGVTHLRHGSKEDDYQRAFHSHTMCSVHCENCRYQEAPRFGDITIGDFWGLGAHEKVENAHKGVSVVLCNNAKGEAFLKALPEEQVGLLKKVPLEWLGGNGFTAPGSHNWIGPKRDLFYDSIRKMKFHEALDYAMKPNHGSYPRQKNNMPLALEAGKLSFSFDPNVWEEHRINGLTTLFVKQRITKSGVYAVMPMDMPLKKGARYILHTRFKARTTSEFLNFNLKDSGNMAQQVMHWHRTQGHDDRWVELKKEFMADSDLYDEIFFGASQIQGEGAYLALDYLKVIEKVNQPVLMNRAWERIYGLAGEEMPWQKIREALRQTDDITAYLEMLLVVAKKCTIILSVKDTPGSKLPDKIVELILALGFTNFSKELWRMYIGFLDGGQVICNQSGEAPEKPVFFNGQAPEKMDEFTVVSKAWRQGNVAEIIINGVNYAVNLRGFNIVVYDREKHEVWDSIGFDGHDNGDGFVRRKV